MYGYGIILTIVTHIHMCHVCVRIYLEQRLKLLYTIDYSSGETSDL